MSSFEAHRVEDFYDVPPVEVLLSGGRHDGKRIFVPDGRSTWLMPDPTTWTLAGPENSQALPRPCTVYRWTGSIRDDGLRIFRAEPAPRPV